MQVLSISRPEAGSFEVLKGATKSVSWVQSFQLRVLTLTRWNWMIANWITWDNLLWEAVHSELHTLN